MQINPSHKPVPAPFTRAEWCALITSIKSLSGIAEKLKDAEERKVFKALSATAQRALERVGSRDFLKDLYAQVLEGDTMVLDPLERSIEKVSKDKSIYPDAT